MCYSYNQGSPIQYNADPNGPSVTLSFTVLLSTSSFVYGSIATMCELPDEDQLCVYVTRSWDGGVPVEIQLTHALVGTNNYGLSLGFTLNQATSTLTLGSPLLVGQTLRITRCSDSSKMLFNFTDGAKLSAKDLNAAFHQLLFLIQEREFQNNVTQNHYPLPNEILVWSAATTYQPGTFVSFTPNASTTSPIIYKALAVVTGGAGPLVDTANWSIVTWVTRGFTTQGGADIVGPIIFDMNNIAPGKALVWNGTKFAATSVTLTGIDDIPGVAITNPADTDILTYNQATSSWINSPILTSINSLTTLDVVNLDLTSWAFYKPIGNGNSLHGAYASGTTWQAWTLGLAKFKNGSEWVIPNPPTVVEIVKEMFPAADPVGFFTNVAELLEGAAAQGNSSIIANLHWDLSIGMDINSSLNAMFFSSVTDLYHPNGPIHVHHIIGSTGNYDSAFRHQTQAGVSQSKIFGYGLANNNSSDPTPGFYLNVPLCKTTCFTHHGITTGGNPAVALGNPQAGAPQVIKITNGGTGYTTVPNAILLSATGSGATLACSVVDGIVTKIEVMSWGNSLYQNVNTTVQITGGGGTGAAATAYVYQPLNVDEVFLEAADQFLDNIRDFTSGYNKRVPIPPTITDWDQIRRLCRGDQIAPYYKGDSLLINYAELHKSAPVVFTRVPMRIPTDIMYVNHMAATDGADYPGNELVRLGPIRAAGSYRGQDYDVTNMNLSRDIYWRLRGVSSIYAGSNPALSRENVQPWSPRNASLAANYLAPWTNSLTAIDEDMVAASASQQYSGYAGKELGLGHTWSQYLQSTAPTHQDGLTADPSENTSIFSLIGNYCSEPRDQYVFNVVLSTPRALDVNVPTPVLPAVGIGEPDRGAVFIDFGFHDMTKQNGKFTDAQQKAMSMLKKEDIRVWASPLIRGTSTESMFTLTIEVPRLKYLGYGHHYSKRLSDTGQNGTYMIQDRWTNKEVAVKYVRMGIPCNMWLTANVLATGARASLILTGNYGS